MTLWYTTTTPPGPLPPMAFDEDGNAWSDLAASAEARLACGFREAPPIPEHDPTLQKPVWAGADWALEGIVPTEVSRLQARLALLAAGKLDEVETAIAAAADRSLAIYWQDTSHFHRDHPRLLALATSLGMSPAEVDALFLAASEIS